MKLKGYSKYEILIDKGAMTVRSAKKILRPASDRFHNNKWYVLRDDNGNKKSISELRIAFCLKHNVAPSDIESKYRFYGTVDNPIIGRREKKTSVTPVIDKILELEKSLDMIKYAYYSNDYSVFARFAYDNREEAIGAVSKVTGVAFKTIENYYDYGVDIFIDGLKNMTFTSLKPIMNYLCSCVKVGYLRNKKPNYEINN